MMGRKAEWESGVFERTRVKMAIGEGKERCAV